MIKNGLKAIRKDHRDLSFTRTFGNVSGETFQDSFSTDAGFPIPNQDTDGLPYGCTGYTQTALCQDEDKAQYVPKFTYDETLAEEGIFPGDPEFEAVGCDIRDSLASTIVYGLQKLGETPATALNYRRGQYFALEQIEGLDWFDTFRSTLQTGGRSISLGSPWYASFATPVNGIVAAPNDYVNDPYSMHNHKICGWTTINGVAYLTDASWQGVQYGVNGFVYFSREIINSLMAQPSSGAFVVLPFTTANAQNVQLTLMGYALSYMRMILNTIVSFQGDLYR